MNPHLHPELNAILLRRKQRLVVPRIAQVAADSNDTRSSEVGASHLAALLREIEPLGYTLSPQLLSALSQLPLSQFSEYFHLINNTLQRMVGAHKKHTPFYPNFPEQVMRLSKAELYLNARMHYLGDWLGLRILPQITPVPRETQTRYLRPPRVIEQGQLTEISTLFQHLMSAEAALSPGDKEDLSACLRHHPRVSGILKKTEFKHREIIAFVASVLLKTNAAEAAAFLEQQLQKPRDLLRLGAALAEGDPSLATPPRFCSLKKAWRRLILSHLNHLLRTTEDNAALKDMARDSEIWKRWGESLHPGDYARRYPLSYAAFQALRNHKTLPLPNTNLEQALKAKQIKKALQLLEENPGELARRLDHLLRLCQNSMALQGWVTDTFTEHIHKVSTRVLLQVRQHFRHRTEPDPLRIFFPKGEVGKLQAIPNTLPALPEALCKELCLLCDNALRKRFQKLPALGTVYIDPQLRYYPIPLGMRSASRALKTLARGSRLPLFPEQVDLPEQVEQNDLRLRFFIWWKDGKQRTDLDLSAFVLDAQHQHIDTFSYYNLQGDYAVHSGDITSAPEGASEFIDIDIAGARQAGVRYVMMVVNAYTRQPFFTLPECFAGYMSRSSGTTGQTGEIYDPRTVENRYDLTGDTKVSVPMIIDLKAHTVIWTDLSLRNDPNTQNNVLNNISSLTLMNMAMTRLKPPHLYDLWHLHAQARGRLTKTPQNADTVFSAEAMALQKDQQMITPLDTEIILSTFL